MSSDSVPPVFESPSSKGPALACVSVAHALKAACSIFVSWSPEGLHPLRGLPGAFSLISVPGALKNLLPSIQRWHLDDLILCSSLALCLLSRAVSLAQGEASGFFLCIMQCPGKAYPERKMLRTQ